METSINIVAVHGGYIVTTQLPGVAYSTEVFTSQSKLLKAVRTVLEGVQPTAGTTEPVSE